MSLSHPITYDRYMARASTSHTTIYLCRHCDVENPRNVLYGHLPDFHLSEKGKRQANSMAAFFGNKKIGAIYVSPLLRAQETAETIAQGCPAATRETLEELIESRFSLYLQGVTKRTVPMRRPLWFVHILRPGWLSIDEGVSTMAARVRAPIERHLTNNPGQSAVFVSHGDPIQSFWIEAKHLPDMAVHRLWCAKGGFLELNYDGKTLKSLAYHSPKELVAFTTPSPKGTAKALQ